MACACTGGKKEVESPGRPVGGTRSDPSAEQYSLHTSDLHQLFKGHFIYSANVLVCLKRASL